MSKYVGITIGPIYTTISEARKPAGLWFASSIFSEITRMLCNKLHRPDVPESMKVNIISPYYDGKNEDENDGIGKYHDRIIFSVDKWNRYEMQKIIDDVKDDIAELLPEEYKNDEQKEFVKKYLNINYMAKDIEGDVNPILELSPYLDAMELMPSVIKDQKNNPFELLLNNESCNEDIKKSKLFTAIKNEENNQLLSSKDSNKSIRSIEEIANVKKDSKDKSNMYFATVAADGDNMGEFLKNLISDNEVMAFSKACLEYSKEAASKVGKFGGMTIYAGGDDLLFLAPVIGNDGKLIIELCNELNNLFVGKIKEVVPEQLHEFIPTISSGIAIHYYKYPLYEALERAKKLLKDIKGKGKDGIAVNIEKHSNQSMKWVIKNNEIDKLLSDLFNDNITSNKVHSAIYTIENMSHLLNVLDEKDLPLNDYIKIWLNFFDNETQKNDIAYHANLAKIYYSNYRNNSKKLEDFTMVLRIDKFLREQRGNC